jgi:hypothetical protein
MRDLAQSQQQAQQQQPKPPPAYRYPRRPLQAGDRVRIAPNGLPMTVKAVLDDGTAWLTWYDKGEKMTGRFGILTLERI